MKTSRKLEMPEGLNDCTLTDVNLLREWLAGIFEQSEQKVAPDIKASDAERNNEGYLNQQAA